MFTGRTSVAAKCRQQRMPSDRPIAPVGAVDAANIDGCQVVARIDGQIVQACEVLWHVNKILEQNRDKIPPEQVGQIRQELIKRELGGLLDRKLLYGEFTRTVPAENLPHIAREAAGAVRGARSSGIDEAA